MLGLCLDSLDYVQTMFGLFGLLGLSSESTRTMWGRVKYCQVQCSNHTLQLSAKALKPFYSARLLDTNDDIDSDDGILVLQAANDEEEENEDENEDGMDDDEDKEKEEDPFTILDNDEREILIQNTEAVHTTLMKVCTFLLLFFFCAHLCCRSRFANSPSLLSIPPPLPFPHGVKPVPLTPFLYSLSLVMSKLNGILHMIC